jgi:hypothetical protein
MRVATASRERAADVVAPIGVAVLIGAMAAMRATQGRAED